jgi:3-oxoacyl-[acyl-carrier protein] reductase
MSKQTVSSKVALVTGGSRGIGRGIALELARAGWDVAVNFARNQVAADETCAAIREIGQNAAAIKGDVGLASDRELMLTQTHAVLGPVSLLINNAGIAPKVRADILEATEDSFDEVLGTNLKGPYFLTQACARMMIDWRDSGLAERPRIVFITSISSFTASTARGDYCVSKAGLSMAVKLFAARLADEGIGVYEIQPGIIQTDMTAKVTEKYDKLINEDGLLPIPRWGTPEDIGTAVRAVAEGRFDYATGIAIPVDGGFHLRTL